MGDLKPLSKSSSWSRSISETINGSHLFTIKGYSLIKGMGAGKYITSDTFRVGGYDWIILFYPDGQDPQNNSVYVSVFIALASCGINVRALFQLTLQNQRDKHRNFGGPPCGTYTLKQRGAWCGHKHFIRRKELETSEYLKDDCLFIHCTVGVVKTHFVGPKQSLIVPLSDNMGQDFKYLLESEVGSDIVFKVKNETFKAHKLILAARSSVFRAQFFGPVGNPSIDEVVVEDIEPFIFKAMLLFIYMDKIPDLVEVVMSKPMCSHTAMLQHLLAAADLYNLDRLKLLCESNLFEDVTTDTVATTIALAEQHHCPKLKAACLKFIANPTNLRAVMRSDAFTQLKWSCPSMLSELLETFALVDNNSSQPLRKKRSRGSIYRQNLAATESVDPNGKQIRRQIDMITESVNTNGRQIRRRIDTICNWLTTLNTFINKTFRSK